MNKKLYLLKTEDIQTKEDMEERLSEINYCEFCNSGSFELSLLQFQLKKDAGIALLEVRANNQVDIKDKMLEMVNCEFCHSDITFSLENTNLKGDTNMDTKFIGTFELTDKNVIISDPCYEKGVWCQGKLDNVKTGTWNAVVKEEDSRIAQLIAYHSDISDIDSLNRKWKRQSFSICVDSGQAGFFQEDKFRNGATSLDLPDYFNNDEEAENEERWYGVCCNITLSRQMAGVLEGGVVATSGYGDGCYTLYTVVDKNKEVIAMKIIFI
jgi:hypothetical protein